MANKSFTAPTKAETQLLAAQWKNYQTVVEKPKLTVYEAVKRYIEIKENVLLAAFGPLTRGG